MTYVSLKANSSKVAFILFFLWGKENKCLTTTTMCLVIVDITDAMTSRGRRAAALA